MSRADALQMPVLLLLPLLVSLLIPPVDSNLNLINGVAGARNLDLNHFTLAGAHNAGSGSFGMMWFHFFPLPVVDCFYRNQDKSITQMLDLGIRYFDFDVSYIEPRNEVLSESQFTTKHPCGGFSNGHYWPTGIVLIHADAESRPLRLALMEIDSWLGDHRNEIVAIRISDHPSCARALIWDHIEGEFNDALVHTGLNSDRNPNLGSAIDSNKRLVLFINTQFGSHPNMHQLDQVISYKNQGSTWTRGCWTVQEIIQNLLSNGWNKVKNTYYQVQVDWYFSYGLCVKDLAGLCDGSKFSRLVEINHRINKQFKRPVNLVMIDYVGHGGRRLSDYVKLMNEENVILYG